MRKLSHLFDRGGGDRQSLKHGFDVAALLHGYDSELIFFVYPNQEGLIVVVVDAASARPVSVQATRFQESIAFLEEEVIVDQLLLDSLVHTIKRVILALKLTIQLRQNAGDQLLNLAPLLFTDARAERVVSQVATDANTSRQNHVGLNLTPGLHVQRVEVHVTDMLRLFGVSMILVNDLVKQFIESVVAVVAASVDSDSRVHVLAAGQDHLLKGYTGLVLLASIFCV